MNLITFDLQHVILNKLGLYVTVIIIFFVSVLVRLLSEKKVAFTKYLTGNDLAKQLGIYNGTVPLKKGPVISTINELVDAINF